ncbi:nucleoside triphosphate pyrophosphohydrolase family protein [Vibrio parahaemolyticus]|uniref:nucleoside triphosphate pyrophosphohydrolase family protein n=1 Tax=Vibrio parahaemolyticus TaxID=670 RepID=UPI00226AD1D8|nr:nucleoside triphosphate pyrophosphohydrolase family protein [Vibrio parahaemolyticus]MCX8796066.1 nucleoside triphosphate pyrophosphohydrolase family protein [Vibrio parahaemolyticus]
MTKPRLTLLTQELKDKLYADIKEFRNMNGLPIEIKDELQKDHDSLHTSLHVEELKELAEAKDLVEISDSLTDQVYVLTGRAVQLGKWTEAVEYSVEVLLHVAKSYQLDFVRLWDEVHASNMSKAAKSMEEYLENERYYADQGVKVEAEEKDGLFIIKCAEDCDDYKGSPLKKGKVMKSIYYKRADLTFVLDGK